MTAVLDEEQVVVTATLDGLRPDPLQTIDEWADEHMILPTWSAEPGKWRTDRTPYLREIMQCLSPLSPVRKVVFMKCAQIGGTSVGTNWIGHMVHRAPTSMLIVEPTVDVAAKLSKQKIQPMFDTVAALKGTVQEARSRDSGNTILAKEFLGGMLVLTGANSGVGLRFMSAKNLFLDEVDGYPYDVDGEGAPVAVAEKRVLTYALHKIYLCSTPVDKATSVIEPAYEASDKRRYHVPCPQCDHPQHLRWANLKWPKGKPKLAEYECESCARMMSSASKTQLLHDGQWLAEHPDRETAGFHLNALYAPYGWVNSWAYLAEQWTRITHTRDLLQQKTFTNTNLAETWEDVGEKLDASGLSERQEVYAAPCPDGVVVLTAGADVQDDRIEVECIGWGLDDESWSIDYQRFYGSPGQPEVWAQLNDWRKKTWLHENGLPMQIVQLAIDSGGHHTKEAYAFAKKYARERVCVTKGSSQSGHPLVGRPTKSNLLRVNLYSIGTDTAKDTLFSRLKLTEFGPGYCHHPIGDTYDAEFFAQLTSEEKRSRYDRGVLQGTYYKKIRARNEALDLKVLNMAALAILNPSIAKLAQRLPARISHPTMPQDAAKTEPLVRPLPVPPALALPLKPAPPKLPMFSQIKKSGFAKGWRR